MGKGKGKQRRLIGNGKTRSPRRLVELSDGNGSGERGKGKGVGKGKGKGHGERETYACKEDFN